MYDNAHHKMHLNATREVHILEVHLDIRFRLWTFAEKGMMTDGLNHRESRRENPVGLNCRFWECRHRDPGSHRDNPFNELRCSDMSLRAEWWI